MAPGRIVRDGLLEMDDDLNRFWPIDELDIAPAIVKPYFGIPNCSGIANRLPDAEQYFAFAAHSICVHIYAFHLADPLDSDTSIVWIAAGNTFDTIIDTYAAFWELYLTFLDRILVP